MTCGAKCMTCKLTLRVCRATLNLCITHKSCLNHHTQTLIARVWLLILRVIERTTPRRTTTLYRNTQHQIQLLWLAQSCYPRLLSLTYPPLSRKLCLIMHTSHNHIVARITPFPYRKKWIFLEVFWCFQNQHTTVFFLNFFYFFTKTIYVLPYLHVGYQVLYNFTFKNPK